MVGLDGHQTWLFLDLKFNNFENKKRKGKPRFGLAPESLILKLVQTLGVSQCSLSLGSLKELGLMW